MLARKDFSIVLILLSVTALAIMSNDLYVPSLPSLADYFSTSAEMVQLTLSLNALALGFTQIFIGPLSDRFGRKPVLLVGVCLMALFSLLCGFAADITELLVFRILQGAAAAVEPVMVIAIFSDLFDEKQRIKIFAVYGMLLALAPAVAPIAGGFVHVTWGWQMNFYILAGLGLFSAWLIGAKLQESIPQKVAKLSFTDVIQRYKQTLSNTLFVRYSLLAGMGVGFIFAYITSAPFILIDIHGVSVTEFGFYQAATIAFYIAGNMIVGRYSEQLSVNTLLMASISLMSLGAAVLAVVVYAGLDTPITLTIAVGIILFGCAPLFAVAPSAAMGSIDSSLTGSASSLLGAIEMVIAGLVSMMVAMMFDGTVYPVVWIMIISSLLVWFIYWPMRDKEGVS